MKDLASDGMTMLVVSHEMGFAEKRLIQLSSREWCCFWVERIRFSRPGRERTREFLSKISMFNTEDTKSQGGLGL